MPERCNERIVLYHGTLCLSKDWLIKISVLLLPSTGFKGDDFCIELYECTKSREQADFVKNQLISTTKLCLIDFQLQAQKNLSMCST